MFNPNYMTLALQLAECGRATVSPNPMVGCVIVNNEQIVGQGYHRYAGGPHAEIDALVQAGEHAKNAVAYVSLEPCCHYGKTPPCTDALIRAGLKKIYVACEDPNPLVAGKGIQQLRDAGIEVIVGMCAAEAHKLNEIFFHYIKHQRPWVLAKWAMSLDGQTITHPADTRAISSIEAIQFSHTIRQQMDAILIGAKTAVCDNPQLTARLSTPVCKQPWRIVLTKHGLLPLDLHIFAEDAATKTIVATTDDVNATWSLALQAKKIEVWRLPKNKEGQIDLMSLLLELGKRQITSLLVEGGMTTHQQFFQNNLVNKIHAYVAPVIIAGLPNKQTLRPSSMMSLGQDYLFIADYGDEHHV